MNKGFVAILLFFLFVIGVGTTIYLYNQKMLPWQLPSTPLASENSKLENKLLQLAQADDYLVFAQKNKLSVGDGKVRVIIETSDPYYVIDNEFGVEEKRSENRIQAYIYINKLKILANEEKVSYIRLPTTADKLLYSINSSFHLQTRVFEYIISYES